MSSSKEKLLGMLIQFEEVVPSQNYIPIALRVTEVFEAIENLENFTASSNSVGDTYFSITQTFSLMKTKLSKDQSDELSNIERMLAFTVISKILHKFKLSVSDTVSELNNDEICVFALHMLEFFIVHYAENLTIALLKVYKDNSDSILKRKDIISFISDYAKVNDLVLSSLEQYDAEEIFIIVTLFEETRTDNHFILENIDFFAQLDEEEEFVEAFFSPLKFAYNFNVVLSNISSNEFNYIK